MGRSRFGDVDRGDDARDTDTDTADDTPHNKVRNSERNARTDSTHQEQGRSRKHAADTPEHIGQATRKVRADGGTDQRKGHGPGKLVIRGVKVDF